MKVKMKLAFAVMCASIQVLTAHTNPELYVIESSLTFQDFVDKTTVKVHLKKRNVDFETFEGMDVVIENSGHKIEIGKEEFTEFSLMNYKSLRVTRSKDFLEGKPDIFQIEIEFFEHDIPGWDTLGKKCMVRIHIIDGAYAGQTVFVQEGNEMKHLKKEPKKIITSRHRTTQITRPKIRESLEPLTRQAGYLAL